ncbi:MAG: hypothetical protein KF712_00725 [Akkermansiaceae bacterium]|nr:hypothetical protein [Akkermansiaceae bacterium]
MKLRLSLLAGVVLLGAMVVMFDLGAKPSDSRETVGKETSAISTAAPVPEESRPGKSQSRPEGTKPEEIDPSQAAKLLADFIAANPNIDAQSKFATDLVKRLCKAGHTAEAFALIGDDNGQVRDFIISAFFEHAQEPVATILDRLTRLPKSDEAQALGGYMNRFSVAELSSVVDEPCFRQLIDSKTISQGSLSAAFTTRLMEAAFMARFEPGAGDPVAEAAKLKNSSLLSPANVINLAGNLPPMQSPADIHSRWALIHDITPGPEVGKESMEERNGMISHMIRLNAPETMAAVLASQGPGQAYNIGQIVDQWAAIDTAGLGRWHQQNKQRMTAEQRTSFAEGLVSRSIRHNDYGSAKEWAGEIQDPAKAAAALARIAEAERK